MADTDESWYPIQKDVLISTGHSYSPPLVSTSFDETGLSSISLWVYLIIILLILGLAKFVHSRFVMFSFQVNNFWKVSSVLLLVFGVYGVFMVFLLWNEPFENVPDKLREGTFGDSFGTLNALFSGLAFSGVLITLLMQRRDLSEAREQNSRQQTESQFYNMLNLQQQVVQAFDLHRAGSNAHTIQGRDCFRDWGRKLKTRYDELGEKYKYQETLERSLEAYEKIMSAHQGDLGLYYRSLYSIFRFIESAEHADRQGFAVVVRSLLSDYELVLLFYNCLSPKGEKFRMYAVMYQLFDNLDVSLLPREEHVEFMRKEAYGRNDGAIDALNRLHAKRARPRL